MLIGVSSYPPIFNKRQLQDSLCTLITAIVGMCEDIDRRQAQYD